MGDNLFDSDLEREIEEHGGGEEDLPADLEVEFHMSSERQVLNQVDLDRIFRLYRILETISTRLVGEGEDPTRPLVGEMAVSERFFECGLSVPLSLYFQELISGLSVASDQLSPNAWRTLVGCYILWKEVAYLPMSWAELNLTYCIKKCLKTGARPNKGFYYLFTYASSTIPVLDNSSSDKHWQRKFFFLSGA